MRLYKQQGLRQQVVDLDTNQIVPKVIWVDIEKGELEAYSVYPTTLRIKQDINGELLTYQAKGRFKLIPYQPVEQRHIATGAPFCVKCNNPLTLPGKDLCPMCNSRDKSYKNSMKAEKIEGVFLTQPCCHKGCQRFAEWSVADEVEVSPILSQRMYYERGATVGRRFYCSFHFQPPRILDEKGEIIEELKEAGGVRPN